MHSQAAPSLSCRSRGNAGARASLTFPHLQAVVEDVVRIHLSVIARLLRTHHRAVREFARFRLWVLPRHEHPPRRIRALIAAAPWAVERVRSIVDLYFSPKSRTTTHSTLRTTSMKKIIAATVALFLSGLASAATIGFSPSTLSVVRGGTSGEITVRILGDYQTTIVEAHVNINLDQFSFYQIESIGSNLCRLSNGKLWVVASVNPNWSTPFPSNLYTNVCKLKVRPRISAPVAAYSLYFTNAYGFDSNANTTSLMTYTATVNVTP
jgi:hypothetical protein